MLCRDIIFFVATDYSSLSWFHAENFVATLKHLSQLTCVISLPFSVVTKLSFVAAEFICQSSAFYVATEKGLSQQGSFAICLDHCRDRVKSVATVFFTFFFSKVMTGNSLSRQKFYFCLEFNLDFVATYSCWLRHSSSGLLEILSRQRMLQLPLFSSFLLELSHFSIKTYKTQSW